MNYTVIIDSKYQVAFDSNDHLYPLGTRNDNYSKDEFICDIEKTFKTTRPLFGTKYLHPRSLYPREESQSLYVRSFFKIFLRFQICFWMY